MASSAELAKQWDRQARKAAGAAASISRWDTPRDLGTEGGIWARGRVRTGHPTAARTGRLVMQHSNLWYLRLAPLMPKLRKPCAGNCATGTYT